MLYNIIINIFSWPAGAAGR